MGQNLDGTQTHHTAGQTATGETHGDLRSPTHPVDSASLTKEKNTFVDDISH